MTEFCHREGFKGGGVGANIKDYIKYNITDIEEIQPDLEPMIGNSGAKQT